MVFGWMYMFGLGPAGERNLQYLLFVLLVVVLV